MRQRSHSHRQCLSALPFPTLRQRPYPVWHSVENIGCKAKRPLHSSMQRIRCLVDESAGLRVLKRAAISAIASVDNVRPMTGGSLCDHGGRGVLRVFRGFRLSIAYRACFWAAFCPLRKLAGTSRLRVVGALHQLGEGFSQEQYANPGQLAMIGLGSQPILAETLTLLLSHKRLASPPALHIRPVWP